MLKKIGVDVDNLFGFPARLWRAGVEICDALARSGAVDIIVVDSVAALTPRAEIEGKWAIPMWVC